MKTENLLLGGFIFWLLFLRKKQGSLIGSTKPYQKFVFDNNKDMIAFNKVYTDFKESQKKEADDFDAYLKDLAFKPK